MSSLLPEKSHVLNLNPDCEVVFQKALIIVPCEVWNNSQLQVSTSLVPMDRSIRTMNKIAPLGDTRGPTVPSIFQAFHSHHLLFKIFLNMYLFIMYTAFLPCMTAGQKMAPDFITDGCEPPCGCWELNSGPLEEQAMLLTSDPSLVFYLIFLKPMDINQTYSFKGLFFFFCLNLSLL